MEYTLFQVKPTCDWVSVTVCTHWFATEYTTPIQANLWLCFLQHKLLKMQPMLYDSSMKWNLYFQSYICWVKNKQY